MQGSSHMSTGNSNVSGLVLAAIMNTLAFVDLPGIMDYFIKASIGGVIWILFKLLGDYLQIKLVDKQKKLKENKEDKKPNFLNP